MIAECNELVGLIESGATAAAKEKAVQLGEGLLTLREKGLALREENLALREKVQGLEKELDTRAKVQWDKPYYWLTDAAKSGPFCQRCYDVDGMLVRLQGGENDTWTCCQCENSFYGAGYGGE